MDEEASWNPASGCFQCPIHIDLRKSWTGINPLPCFPDLSRGYFSVPLNGMYIPLAFSESEQFLEMGYLGGNYVIGEVDNAQVNKYFAIGAHEKGHIHQTIFPVKGLIHRIIDNAYQCLFQIISENDHRAWKKLQECNFHIGKLIDSITFIEELIATFIGCTEFRENTSEPHSQTNVDKMEEDLVQAHSKLFGPEFGNLYSQFVAIYSRFGLKHIQIITFYSMDYLEVEYFGKNIGISYYKSNVETPMARLYRCLEPFSTIRQISGVHKWTECDWLEFFGAYLVDFRRWRAGRQELSHYVKQMLSQCQEWWIAKGVNDVDNPLIAAEWLRSARGEFHTKALSLMSGHIF
jgi:hypothetical protein